MARLTSCLLIGLTLLGLGTRAIEQTSPAPLDCVHNDQCRAGECQVWESSRWVCEPETYAVMVFPSKCIIKDKLGPNARLEMRMDSDGKPDRSTARLIGTQVTFKPDCGHIEIRKRAVNY